MKRDMLSNLLGKPEHIVCAALFLLSQVAFSEIIPSDRRINWNPGVPSGIPNRTTINTTLALARVLQEGGEALEEAAALYRRVEEAATGASRGRSVQAGEARLGQALTLLDDGEEAAALAIFVGADATVERLMQDEFDYDEVPHLPDAVRRTVLLDPAAGAARLEAELARLRVALPADHVRIAEALLQLGGARLRQGNVAAALEPLREALRMRSLHFVPGSWRRAEASLALGLCLAKLDQRAAALDLLRDGLRQASGRHPKHPWVAAALKLSS